jgi:hypothetical protein
MGEQKQNTAEPLKVTLESIGESEVRLYRSDAPDNNYTYLVYVTPGHADRFAQAVNKAIDDLTAQLALKTAQLEKAMEAVEHYGDKQNWQEDSTPELTTYVVWKRLPDEGNELYSGPDIARQVKAEIEAMENAE